MKCYYAHCMNIYGSPQEERDIELLESLGFTVLNPGESQHEIECQKRVDTMSYFLELVEQCDVVAFRALPDQSIPAGVAREISHGTSRDKPVFELPSSILRRTLSTNETREYLFEIGQR